MAGDAGDDQGGRLLEPGVLDRLVRHLEGYGRAGGEPGIELSPGLSDAEVDAVEHRWALVLPPDLRALLERCVPVGGRFVDWRDDDAVAERLAWPADGIASDVVRSGLWLRSWGDRPGDDAEALAVARAAVDAWPQLLPLYAHRYLVGDPPIIGNPVLSVYQSDIIFYGDNLADWFHRDFGFEAPVPSDGPDRDLGPLAELLGSDDLW